MLTTHHDAQAEPTTGVEDESLTDPALYNNLHLSWLAFNERVMEEGEDERHPLLERAKFLAIVTSNSDEFFMVRVAALRHAQASGAGPLGDDGLTPSEVLAEITRRSQALGDRQLRCWRDDVSPALAAEQIHVLDYADLDDTQRSSLALQFQREIAPLLTPLAIDTGHPFPFISNQSLNLLIILGEGAGERVARLRMPSGLPRLVAVEPGSAQAAGGDSRARTRCFVWLEQLVAANIQTLFTGVPVSATYPFRVLRNADFEIQEDETADLLRDVEAMLRRRRFGYVTCVMVDRSMPRQRREWLAERLDLGTEGMLLLDGPLGLSELLSLLAIDRPDLKDAPLVPRMPAGWSAGAGVFDVLKRRDVLVHHPYDSFETVIDFVQAAARDPDVRAIKQTLYRVGHHSPIVEALEEARDANTEVAVVLELKARFDEASNIGWAQTVEAKGVHVVYGLPGLKVHSKVALIVREESDGLRRYVHLGTGNYNPSTARLYTDLGLLSSRSEFGSEASELFNFLTGYSEKRDYKTLLVSPLTTRTRLMAMIEREVEFARRGEPARLIFKMNQLSDGPMIRALYRAAQAGAQIDLLVRGLCCLRPGVPGVSDGIRVTSIVGRFLEHGRVYYFRNGGDDEIYLGSADLMPRNLDRRVEVVFPVLDPDLRRQVRDGILAIELRDTSKARRLESDGTYTRLQPEPGTRPFDSQAWFMSHPLGDQGC